MVPEVSGGGHKHQGRWRTKTKQQKTKKALKYFLSFLILFVVCLMFIFLSLLFFFSVIWLLKCQRVSHRPPLTCCTFIRTCSCCSLFHSVKLTIFFRSLFLVYFVFCCRAALTSEEGGSRVVFVCNRPESDKTNGAFWVDRKISSAHH